MPILPILPSPPISSHILSPLLSPYLNSLPPSVIDIRLQLPRNYTRDPMLKPHGPQKSIIPLLMQIQLSSMSEPRVNLAVLINIGSDHPAARQVVEVEDAALADVDEESDVGLAPGGHTLIIFRKFY
jgi:hypothetical protein